MPSLLPGRNNQLLSALPLDVRKSILEKCETVDLAFGDILYEANQPLHFLYFPLSCLISLLTRVEECEPLEMGLIGHEGMLGATMAFEIDKITMQCVVQGRGKCLRLTVSQFRPLLRKSPELKKFLSRYLYVLMEQLMQSAACTYSHTIEPRLARWLLMSQDRVHQATLQLTHKFLAGMLGVRRSGVTIAAGKLQSMGLIQYNRGRIKILNRKGLEAVSCRCYKTMKQVYTDNLNQA